MNDQEHIQRCRAQIITEQDQKLADVMAVLNELPLDQRRMTTFKLVATGRRRDFARQAAAAPAGAQELIRRVFMVGLGSVIEAAFQQEAMEPEEDEDSNQTELPDL